MVILRAKKPDSEGKTMILLGLTTADIEHLLSTGHIVIPEDKLTPGVQIGIAYGPTNEQLIQWTRELEDNLDIDWGNIPPGYENPERH